MTTWIAKITGASRLRSAFNPKAVFTKSNLIVVLMLLALFLIQHSDQQLFEIIVVTLGDAYLGVSIFIALTLAGFYALDGYFKSDVTRLLNERSFIQVPAAAFLGALPGCGGAIIVVTQFVNGHMSFGALVAVLISTMGDAAFLLLARKPEIALLVYSISLTAGVLFGYLVNYLHSADFLKSEKTTKALKAIELQPLSPGLISLFIVLLVPGCVFGVLDAFQYDASHWFGPFAALEPLKWLGFIGAFLCIMIWVSQPLDSWSARFAKHSDTKCLKESVVAETSFVSVWVILGFLAYELLVYFSGIDLNALFVNLGAIAILFAILIGFVPGCGPQILMTTLYINGVVPLSAQLANAISNDGDALFPALALAPKAALYATLYSAVPAFIIGYGAFYLGS